MEKKLMIEGMMCKMCKAHVEKALAAVAGVESYNVDLEGKCATVTGTAEGFQSDVNVTLTVILRREYSSRRDRAEDQ